MRLKDADALKENFPLPCEEWEMKGQQTLWDAREIRERIDLMPTIDAVPVVRCKDCKHYKKSEVAEQYMCYRKDVEGWPVCYDFMPTDFCKYGERRTDETD